ncbi:MAG: hypothetical protein RMK18_00595 [Armatimonadota bacterium]|nr:hypothetical protein [Armatimonadota bacterium]MDW8024352.1 hypothetical protein [Armatimonadota bacterium]
MSPKVCVRQGHRACEFPNGFSARLFHHLPLIAKLCCRTSFKPCYGLQAAVAD